MNILILSCGTKSLLVDYFRDRKNGFDKVIVTDCNAYSPALYRADKYYIVPRMKEPTYFPTLFDICEKEEINAVLPLQEDELVLIAEHAEEFRSKGVFLIISLLDIIKLCRDKYSFYTKMQEIGVPAIPTGLIEDKDKIIEKYGFPLFMKPRYGAGSVSNFKINKECAIDGNVENENEEFIIQPYIDGDAYVVNFYVDFKTGELTDIFIMRKISARAGEADKSVSVHDAAIEETVRKICENIPFKGPIDMDVIKKDGKCYVIEVNPRFGGGYPHTHSCGINFIKRIANNVGEIANRSDESKYDDGIVAFRYMTISLIRKDEMPHE